MKKKDHETRALLTLTWGSDYTGDAGVQAHIRALRCSVHPVPVLIILSLGVVEEWS